MIRTAWEIKLNEIREKIGRLGLDASDKVIVFTCGDADWYRLQNRPTRWWKTPSVERVIFDKRGYEWVEGGKVIWGRRSEVPMGRVWLGSTEAYQRMGEFYSVNVYLVPVDKVDNFVQELIENNDGSIEGIGVVEL